MKIRWIKELKEDFLGPLEEVRNVWVRRGVCAALGLSLAIPAILSGAFAGALDFAEVVWNEFVLPTWKGPKK